MTDFISIETFEHCARLRVQFPDFRQVVCYERDGLGRWFLANPWE
jgi:hypothetical protein